MKKILIRYVSKQLGAWKNARTRGYFRVSLVDDSFTYYERERWKGHIRTLFVTNDCTLDYEGGSYGYARQREQASSFALIYSIKHNIPFFEKKS